MDPEANVIQTLQNQAAQLQQQIAAASTAYQQIAAANNNVANNNNLKAAKPEKFSGTNVRSWLKSINNVFDSWRTVHPERRFENSTSHSTTVS